MPNTRKLPIILGFLTIAVLGSAYSVRQAWAVSVSDSLLAQQIVTATPTSLGGTATPALVNVWSQFCVGPIAYALLAVPEDANFQASISDSSALLPVVASTQRTTVSTPTPQQIDSGTSAVASNANADACEVLGAMDGQRMILCRGNDLSALNVSVGSASGAEEYAMLFGACNLPPAIPEGWTGTQVATSPTSPAIIAPPTNIPFVTTKSPSQTAAP